ncbi:UNVERIFIED_CONTAM: Pentatricopeptide repeat-containing protein, chloroplastic [Sesamum calycinum]|uniref:Pentatricopeptide repeat-containing protein, chloroplastic n=1 Tax=Sesamum calycinum TaxID=2727403 RepID=A0AAW2NTK7_9LAMI
MCKTTICHSLCAAYVGFGDLETAEKLVQAMREGRRDICRVLRDSCLEDRYSDDENEVGNECDAFAKLLPNSIDFSSEPPELPQAVPPDSRIYTTLMKGYMKAGRVADTVRMLEAMRHQKDSTSHPDHVTYTTVISAFVKAGSMDKARQVLKEMARIRVLLDQYNIFSKGAGALTYFNEMRKRGIAPTKVSYTTLMKAFASSGQPKLANKVFDEMLKDPRVKVDLVAWNMLVEGYCKTWAG